MNWTKKPVPRPWWFWVVAVDLFFIAVTAAYRYIPAFGGKSRLLGPFNLATEMNIAVWWAGICFFVLALLAFELFCSGTDRKRTAWLSLSLLFFALYCDETGSIHERIGGWSNLLPFGIGAVALLMYSLVILYKGEETRKSALFIFFGFAFFGAAAFQEHLEHTLNWPGWMTGIRVGVEEGTELAGTFLIFWGVLKQRAQRDRNSLLNAVPNLYRMGNIEIIIFCGLLLHLLASAVLPGTIDTGQGGNPLVLYPAALYMMLFAGSFRHFLIPGTRSRRIFGFLALFFAISSMGSIYNLFLLIPGSGGLIPMRFNSGFYSLHLFQFLVIILLLKKKPVLFANHKLILISIFIMFLLAGLTAKALSMQAALSGMISWLIAGIFLPELSWVRAKAQGRIAGPESFLVSLPENSGLLKGSTQNEAAQGTDSSPGR